jgi:hypothetical protein
LTYVFVDNVNKAIHSYLQTLDVLISILIFP